jgi:hypothetical protein
MAAPKAEVAKAEPPHVIANRPSNTDDIRDPPLVRELSKMLLISCESSSSNGYVIDNHDQIIFRQAGDPCHWGIWRLRMKVRMHNDLGSLFEAFYEK